MTAQRRRVAVVGAAFAGTLLIVAAVPEFRRGLVSMTKPDPVGPAIYSKSALGHAALFDMLDEIGIPVVESDLGSGAHFEPNSVRVIAEPRTDDATLDEVRAMLDAPTVFLVLPKREGKPDPKRPNWIGEDRLIAQSDVQQVLRLADKRATLARDAPADSWNASQLGDLQPSIRHAQLIHSSRLHPLLASSAGILIGEIRERGRRLVVVSDPDMIANHGIARGDNAQIVVNVIERMRSGHDGVVVFDEFIHGYSPRPFHMLGILFQFPFALVTAQAAVAIALLAWAAMGRFGAPREQPPAISAGRRSLIDAGAMLVSRNGDAAALEARYYEEMVRDTAGTLRAPSGLALPDLLQWFAETQKDAAIPRDPQQVYAWRKELTGGISQRS